MTTDTLLRTGEAARLLGVSRQHVVDMCNQGKLPFITVGTHRRIPKHAVAERVSDLARPNGDQLSLWLHAALIPRLISNPAAVISTARANLARGRANGAIDIHSEPYAREWEKVLDDGVGAVIEVCLDPTDRGVTLRSSTPFAGVLPQVEVRALRKACRELRGKAGQ